MNEKIVRQRLAELKKQRMEVRAKRTFMVGTGGELYHDGTLNQWKEFRTELKTLMEKHGITTHCFELNLIRVDGKLTPIAQP